jgi:hypothetical protein
MQSKPDGRTKTADEPRNRRTRRPYRGFRVVPLSADARQMTLGTSIHKYIDSGGQYYS